MKLLVDNIDSITGWSGSGGASVYGTNAFPEFRAGNTDASLIVHFNGIDSYVQKTYDIDCSDYTEFVMWISSRNKGTNDYRTVSDYSYKIELYSGAVWYLPVFNDFYMVRINITDLVAIDKIKITSLHDGSDYLILNYALVSRDILPYDIFSGIKEQLEYLREQYISSPLIGTITGSEDDTYIEFASSVEYLDRYSVVYINDGVNSETHQIIAVEGNKYTFGKLYDGETLLNDYSDASVYLFYPIEFGTTQKEILLPSITIWGFSPTRENWSTEFDHIIDSVHLAGTFEERQVGQWLLWDILIDCESQEEWEALGELSYLVRKFIGQRKFWVNGRKCNIEISSPAQELYPTEAYDVIPKIQYSTTVSIREELYNPDVLPEFTTLNITATPVEQGEIDG